MKCKYVAGIKFRISVYLQKSNKLYQFCSVLIYILHSVPTFLNCFLHFNTSTKTLGNRYMMISFPDSLLLWLFFGLIEGFQSKMCVCIYHWWWLSDTANCDWTATCSQRLILLCMFLKYFSEHNDCVLIQIYHDLVITLNQLINFIIKM